MRKPSQEKSMNLPLLASEFSEILKQVALILREERCSSAEVCAALLFLCGVPVEGANMKNFLHF